MIERTRVIEDGKLGMCSGEENGNGCRASASHRTCSGGVSGVLSMPCSTATALRLSHGVISKHFCRDHDAHSVLEWAGSCCVAHPGLNLKVALPERLTHSRMQSLAAITNSTSSQDIICESETNLSPLGDAVLYYHHGWVDLKATKGVVRKH